jgi:hypothetical protein
MEPASSASQRAQHEKNENQIYLESNELNKLMETLMGQIRAHKPEDIVRATRNSILPTLPRQFYNTVSKL